MRIIGPLSCSKCSPAFGLLCKLEINSYIYKSTVVGGFVITVDYPTSPQLHIGTITVTILNMQIREIKAHQQQLVSCKD